jgi:hypothetical protein
MTISDDRQPWGWNPPTIVCDEIPENFFLFVNISLRWSAWDANTEVNSATVIIHPNGKSSQNEPEMNPFEISIPTNVLNSKPNEWSTLSIVFETTLGICSHNIIPV